MPEDFGSSDDDACNEDPLTHDDRSGATAAQTVSAMAARMSSPKCLDPSYGQNQHDGPDN